MCWGISLIPFTFMAFYKKSNFDSDIEIPVSFIEERRAKLAEFLYVDVSILKPEPGQLDYVGEMLVLAEELRLKRERETCNG